MLKLLFAALLFVLFSAGINAQSEDCAKKCAKETTEVTKDTKHCDTEKTVSTIETVEPIEVAGALGDNNKTVVVKKEVKVTDHKDAMKDDKGCCSADKTKTDDNSKTDDSNKTDAPKK